METPADLPPHSQNVEEELDRIRSALDAVFSVSSQPPQQGQFTQRQFADRYLTSFQNTSLAWMVCDRLLADTAEASPEKQQQRLFFAAQTLHKKCHVDIFELPADSLPSLRDSLLNHLQRYVTAGALRTRLAMCVAALAVQMNWSTIVTELLANPSAVLLPILRVLPEECASDRIILLNDQFRFDMRDHLISSAPAFFQYLRAIAVYSSLMSQAIS